MYQNIFLTTIYLKHGKTLILPFPNKANVQSCIILLFKLYRILVIFPIFHTRKLYDCLQMDVYTRVKIRKYLFKPTHHCVCSFDKTYKII